MSEDKEDPILLPDFDTELGLVVIEEKPKKISTLHEVFGDTIPEYTIDWEYLKKLPEKRD